MRGGLLALGMFVALIAGAIVIITLVRVPEMYAVEGRGEVKYTPNEAEITSSIYVESDVSLDAVKNVAATMRQILAALKAAGVDAADVKALDVRSGLLEERGGASRRPDDKRAYYAEQAVVVTVHDIARIGKILDAIARAGSNYWQVKYTTTDSAKLQAEVRKAALLDAITTADAYAREGKFKRGRVLKIQDNDVSFPEVDYPDRGYRTPSNRYYGGSGEKVVVTGSRITDVAPENTFDIPPPREKTVTAATNVLFEID